MILLCDIANVNSFWRGRIGREKKRKGVFSQAGNSAPIEKREKGGRKEEKEREGGKIDVCPRHRKRTGKIRGRGGGKRERWNRRSSDICRKKR